MTQKPSWNGRDHCICALVDRLGTQLGHALRSKELKH